METKAEIKTKTKNEMKEEKISIIIPVYKVEAYLPKCLDSVLQQTYRNLEIILIDDGSPDGCGKICDEYSKKDARISVIHKENTGVARARNDGIEAATGAYISFIDSDDWISPRAYEWMYKYIKKYKADCAVGGCVTVKDQNGKLKFPKNTFSYKATCETSEGVIKNLLLNASAMWNRLFRREIFETLRFPQGRINDDEVTVLHAYAQCKKIVFVNRPTYFYRIRENSITTSCFSIRNVDYYYNSLDNEQFIREQLPQLQLCAEFKVVKSLLYCYVNLRKLSDSEEKRKLKKELKREIQKKRKAALKNPYLGIEYKLLICLLR